MSLVVSFTVSQASDGSSYTIVDTSNYAANGGKAAFTNRQLLIYFSDGTQQAYTPTPFSFANYPSDTLTISGQTVDYALRIVLSVDDALAATVTTTAVTDITQTSAVSGGDVTSDGGTTVTAKGVCWNTTGSPTISDSHTTNGSGTGAFASNLTGLSAGTIYYVRAYATNAIGTSYGNEQTFSTADLNPVILSTVAQSNYNAIKGSTFNIAYILEVQNTAPYDYNAATLASTIFGNNVGVDIASNGVKIQTNTTPDLSGSPTPILQFSASGTSTFNFSKTVNIAIPANTTLYVIISLDINAGALDSQTLYMNGLNNPIVLTIDGNPPQVNNQTNVSPTLTIVPNIYLSTVAGSNYTANKSTSNNIVYVLEMQNNNISAYTITAISLGLYGQDVGADVATNGLKIYTNSVPDLTGSPVLKRAATVSGTTAFLTTLTAFSINLPASQTTYLVLSVDINSGATTGHTLFMSASDSPIGLTITGNPLQQDSQTDVSPIITVGV